MAKVIAPLFSFSAGGKLAKSIVFGSWKGIAVVRQYIVPANPNSAAQQSQRSKLTSAVSDWHDPNLTADDSTAYNAWASIASKPLSGFNQFVKDNIRVQALGDTWIPLTVGLVAQGASGELDVSVESADGTSPCKAHYGVKKTLLLSEAALSYSVDTWSASITSLPSGTKYYVQFRQIAAGVEGNSGIFEQIVP